MKEKEKKEKALDLSLTLYFWELMLKEKIKEVPKTIKK